MAQNGCRWNKMGVDGTKRVSPWNIWGVGAFPPWPDPDHLLPIPLIQDFIEVGKKDTFSYIF